MWGSTGLLYPKRNFTFLFLSISSFVELKSCHLTMNIDTPEHNSYLLYTLCIVYHFLPRYALAPWFDPNPFLEWSVFIYKHIFSVHISLCCNLLPYQNSFVSANLLYEMERKVKDGILCCAFVRQTISTQNHKNSCCTPSLPNPTFTRFAILP